MVSGDVSDSAWRPPAEAPGQVEQLDGYDGLVEVGRGGDSIVYRARQVSIGRDVAVKVLLVDDEERAARFAREIEITVDLGRQHPNVVTVLATGTTASGRPAIVMDFCEGGTLHDRLKAHGPLPVEEVTRIGEVLADALSFAHDRGILHRDVKPQNVLVLPTSWVLADFGIARLVDSDHTSSAETFTYRHAAPQILDGYPPTAADDIWSLGSTLYTLLDGRPPFASDDPDDDSALAYLRRARTEPHRPLTGPGTERIAGIIDRCLAKDVGERWATAGDLRDALQRLRRSAWEPGATPAGADSTAPRRPSPAAPPPVPTPDLPDEPAPPISAVPVAPAPVPSPEPEPPPVALSAVSHAAGVPADAEPTGAGFLDRTGAGPSAGRPPRAPDADHDPSGRRSRVPLILGAAALVIGLVLGVIGAILRSDGDGGGASAETTPTETQATIPSLTAEPSDAPTFSGDPNPELELVLQRVEPDGTSAIRAKWTDPSKGTGTFVLHQVSPVEELVGSFATGQTEGQAVYPVPLGESCYYMTVHVVGEGFGISNQMCVVRQRP